MPSKKHKLTPSRDLWTIEGTNALIRKLQYDPGLTEEFRREAIDSVRSGAVEKGLFPKETVEQKKKEKLVPKKEVQNQVKEEAAQVDPWSNFDAYQAFTTTTALYPPEVGLAYTTTGLCGEAAEVAGKVQAFINKHLMISESLAGDDKLKNTHTLNDMLKHVATKGEELEKFKKAVRKSEKKLLNLKSLSEQEKLELAKEAGDALWYIAQLSRNLGIPMSEIAKMNVMKLSSRKERGTLHGSGDNR